MYDLFFLLTVYGIQAAMVETYVDDVFGGKLASSITCLQCKTVSDKSCDSHVVFTQYCLFCFLIAFRHARGFTRSFFTSTT